MNRERRATPKRRPCRLATPTRRPRGRASARPLDPADIAPWVLADVRGWPRSVEDRLVAIALGVQLQHVQHARKARP